jgi:hypothetical protein
VVAHLHGGLGDAWNLMAVLFKVGQIAKDEDVGQASGVERSVDGDTASAIESRAEELAER